MVICDTADDVSIEGGNKLPYVPLRDTFDTYTEDCWTYDGRYMISVFSDLMLSFTHTLSNL